MFQLLNAFSNPSNSEQLCNSTTDPQSVDTYAAQQNHRKTNEYKDGCLLGCSTM
jgi:hypothetical protein